ncbi:hypothetical protein AB0758_43830 [Tolypothrix bouteillei VB521301_2]|uniref:hypothetical protein n=1 Tax=Tolypothrix bouteillei TaxID=1246981 RepID=UPI0038B4B467
MTSRSMRRLLGLFQMANVYSYQPQVTFHQTPSFVIPAIWRKEPYWYFPHN